MSRSRRLLGRIGESLASEYLVNLGHKVLERNFTTKYGEIDIITKKDDLIHFIEVRTANNTGIEPEYTITNSKIKHLINTAKIYISNNSLSCDYSFDLLAIKKKDNGYDTNYIENIF